MEGVSQPLWTEDDGVLQQSVVCRRPVCVGPVVDEEAKVMVEGQHGAQFFQRLHAMVSCHFTHLDTERTENVSFLFYLESVTVELVMFVGCLTFQRHASVSLGQIYLDNCMCCHTETEVAGQTFYLSQSQHIDTRPTSPSTYPVTPGAWQVNHLNTNC